MRHSWVISKKKKVWFSFSSLCSAHLICSVNMVNWFEKLIWQMKKKKFFWWSLSLLGELNQVFMIKWSEGKPEGKVRLPCFDSSKLLIKLAPVSCKSTQFLYGIQSSCEGATSVLHNIFLLFPSVRYNNSMPARWTCLTSCSDGQLAVFLMIFVRSDCWNNSKPTDC